MRYSYLNKKTGGVLYLVCEEEGFDRQYYRRDHHRRYYTICWNRGKDQQVTVDNVEYAFPENGLLPLTIHQSFRFQHPEQIVAWQFNREFYCIVNHDREVGCAGFLFYGPSGNLFIRLAEAELGRLKLLYEFFRNEFDNADHIQEDMLRMLLVRLIVNITRTAREQFLDKEKVDERKFDIIRKFNLLVEMHYREQHDVGYYAKRLHKSPKTLSNYFALYDSQSPLQVIHARLIMEAKRLFLYTQKSAKEVSSELGFGDASHFSRFFRTQAGESVSEFKKNYRSRS